MATANDFFSDGAVGEDDAGEEVSECWVFRGGEKFVMKANVWVRRGSVYLWRGLKLGLGFRKEKWCVWWMSEGAMNEAEGEKAPSGGRLFSSIFKE